MRCGGSAWYFAPITFPFLLCLTPSPRQVAAFSLVAAKNRGRDSGRRAERGTLVAAPPPAIVKRAAHRAASTLPVASIILKFEGKVTFAL